MSTVRRCITKLLEDGIIREGDQRHVAFLPADSRPVVYDLAMSDATRQAWRAEYETNGASARRLASARAGSAGGARSAQVRRGVNLEPPILTESGPVDGARGCICGVTGLHPEHARGCTGATQTKYLNQVLEPSSLKTSAPTADAADTGDGFGTELLPIFDSPAVSASKPTKTKGAGDEDEARAIVSELTRLYADTVKAAGGTVTGSLMAAVGRNLKTHVVKDGLGVEALSGPVVAAAKRGMRGVTGFLAAPNTAAPAQSFREQERARVDAGMAESAARINAAFPDGLPDLGLKPIPGVSVPYVRRGASQAQYPQYQDRTAITATAEHTDPWES